MADTAQIIVYLRDNADYNTVSQMFRQKYPNVPTVFTLAPVCRPTWLIEMECIAIRTATNNTFNNF
jgi:enamine deaminase RidA (YjgF/YER057c/UK114 family)